MLLATARLKGNKENQGEFSQGHKITPVLVPMHCLPTDIPSMKIRQKTGFLRISCFVYGIWFAIYLFIYLFIVKFDFLTISASNWLKQQSFLMWGEPYEFHNSYSLFQV